MMLSFNQNDIMNFIDEFDYLKTKYDPLINELDIEGRESLIPFLYKAFCGFERNKHHKLYSKINYADIKKNVKMIYDNDKKADRFVLMYDFALDCLIDRYLNIESLENLFNHHYFEFEWKQHADLDFEKNDLSFYRDHFIHQVRNSYMIMRLLNYDNCDFLKKIKYVLKNQNSELSKYACVKVNQYKEHVVTVVRSVVNNHKSQIEKIFKLAKQSGSSNNTYLFTEEAYFNQILHQLLETNAVDDFSWEYLIRGSLIVAALFHDIGYPVKFTYSEMEKLNDYISLIIPSDNFGFDRLNDILENSLLFSIEDKKVLKNKYDRSDHGALSAFILLLHFYENGTIHALNPLKKAMIELAALIIFDHTLEYKINNDREFDKDKPSFLANPLSYTLRFIDDLQEWERVYFEIKNNNDLLFCNDCKMPISPVL